MRPCAFVIPFCLCCSCAPFDQIVGQIAQGTRYQPQPVYQPQQYQPQPQYQPPPQYQPQPQYQPPQPPPYQPAAPPPQTPTPMVATAAPRPETAAEPENAASQRPMEEAQPSAAPAPADPQQRVDETNPAAPPPALPPPPPPTDDERKPAEGAKPAVEEPPQLHHKETKAQREKRLAAEKESREKESARKAERREKEEAKRAAVAAKKAEAAAKKAELQAREQQSLAQEAQVYEGAVDATTLWRDYDSNEVRADEQYKGKRFKVKGVIQSIDKDFTGSLIVRLRSPNRFMSADAYITDDYKAKVADLSKGQRVLLECICKGITLGSPHLKDCSILIP